MAEKTTYYVELSHDSSSGRRFTRLSSASVLAWFRHFWREALRGKVARVGPWLDEGVYGLDALYEAISEGEVVCPTSDAELLAFLDEHIEASGDLEVESHFVHIQTDDGETEFDYYFFDDEFLRGRDARTRLPDPGLTDDAYARLLRTKE